MLLEGDTHIVQQGVVHINFNIYCCPLPTCVLAVDELRNQFMLDTLDTHHSYRPWPIRRTNVYSDVVETYQENISDILQEYPFRIRYEDEQAVDTGGVCRDMFSSLWKQAYINNFDGESLLIPAIHSDTDMATFPVLGTVLSHGFMVCGYLPVRIAFCVLATVLCYPGVHIPDEIVIPLLIISYLTRTLFFAALLSKSPFLAKPKLNS